MHARSLSKVAGPDNGRALHAMGEAQILGKNPAGWAAARPRHCPGSAANQHRRMGHGKIVPVLAALAAEQGFTLESLNPPTTITPPDTRPHVSDPVAELQTAAAATVLPEAAEAARLTEAALVRKGQDNHAADARGSGASVPASDRPSLRLRLPTSWFAANTDSGP